MRQYRDTDGVQKSPLSCYLHFLTIPEPNKIFVRSGDIEYVEYSPTIPPLVAALYRVVTWPADRKRKKKENNNQRDISRKGVELYILLLPSRTTWQCRDGDISICCHTTVAVVSCKEHQQPVNNLYAHDHLTKGEITCTIPLIFMNYNG